MKSSFYNYIFYRNNYRYWFNGITKSYFRLTHDLGKKIEMLLVTPDVLLEQTNIANKLINNGFWLYSNIRLIFLYLW